MKLKKKTLLYIVLGVAVALFAALCVWAFVITMHFYKKTDDTSDVSSKITLGYTSELSNQSELEQDEEETSTVSPIVVFPVKDKQNTNSYVSSSETVNSSLPSQDILDVPSQQPSVSTNMDEVIDYIEKSNFLMQYSLAKTQYNTQLNKDINEAKQQISYYSDKLNECAVNEAIAIKNLNEQMANAGLLQSSYYDQQLRRIKNNYLIEKNTYKSQISYYEEQIKYLQEQQTNPDESEIKSIMSENTGTSYEEISEKYDKYIQ